MLDHVKCAASIIVGTGRSIYLNFGVGGRLCVECDVSDDVMSYIVLHNIYDGF